MKEKINVAKILERCPSGMELDCTMFDNVTFVKVEDAKKQFPIEIIVGGIHSKYLTKEGCFHDNTLIPEAKCVIFPKGRTTWEGFIPPYMFKDGDIVFGCNNVCSYITIYKNDCDRFSFNFHACLSSLGKFRVDSFADNMKLRHATEKEKQKLFDVIRENGYRWNDETKALERLPKFKVGNKVKSKINQFEYTIVGIKKDCYIMNYANKADYHVPFCNEGNFELVPNKFDISALIPFESKVLVRGENERPWKPAEFGYFSDGFFYVLGGNAYKQCIPYEGNEHLRGNTDNCAEYYRTWE